MNEIFSTLKSVGRKNIFAILFVWSGTILSAVLGFLIQIILSKNLDIEEYGRLSSALSIVNILSPFAGFGVTSLWLKVYGSEREFANRWLKKSLIFVFASSSITMFSIIIWSILGPNNQFERYNLIALSSVVWSYVATEILSARYQLENKFVNFSFVRLLIPAFRFFTVLMIVILGFDLNDFKIVNIYAIISVVIVLFLSFGLKKIYLNGIEINNGRLGLDSTDKFSGTINLKEVISSSWVFGTAGVLYLAWSQGHVVIAKYLLGNEAAAIYNISLVISTAICLLPSVAYSKLLLPKIHYWANHDQVQLKNVFHLGSKIMFLSGGVIMLILIAGAPLIVRYAFGDKYISAIPVIQIIALTLPFRFLGYNVGALLVAKRYMKLKLKVMVLMATFNYTIALMFIPIWGVEGLAASIFITEIILISIYRYLVKVNYKF